MIKMDMYCDGFEQNRSLPMLFIDTLNTTVPSIRVLGIPRKVTALVQITLKETCSRVYINGVKSGLVVQPSVHVLRMNDRIWTRQLLYKLKLVVDQEDHLAQCN